MSICNEPKPAIRSARKQGSGAVKPPANKLATIRELAEELQIPASWFYERSRTNSLPGMIRIGKYIRIDREIFYAALRQGRVK